MLIQRWDSTYHPGCCMVLLIRIQSIFIVHLLIPEASALWLALCLLINYEVGVSCCFAEAFVL